jgi:hypothetical protein
MDNGSPFTYSEVTPRSHNRNQAFWFPSEEGNRGRYCVNSRAKGVAPPPSCRVGIGLLYLTGSCPKCLNLSNYWGIPIFRTEHTHSTETLVNVSGESWRSECVFGWVMSHYNWFLSICHIQNPSNEGLIYALKPCFGRKQHNKYIIFQKHIILTFASGRLARIFSSWGRVIRLDALT